MKWIKCVASTGDDRSHDCACRDDLRRSGFRLEAWTRDDAHVQRWYEHHGFTQIDSYSHVYLERDDLRPFDGELRFVRAFAHYTGDEPEKIRRRYLRVHSDVLYEKQL